MEFSSIICSLERLNFEVSTQDDRFDVMPRGSLQYRFLYGKAIQKLVSSFQLRAIPAFCINHIRITKAFWETGKTSSILLVW